MTIHAEYPTPKGEGMNAIDELKSAIEGYWPRSNSVHREHIIRRCKALAGVE